MRQPKGGPEVDAHTNSIKLSVPKRMNIHGVTASGKCVSIDAHGRIDTSCLSSFGLV